MDLKKLTGKLTTIVAAGAMVMSIGGGVVWANNCKDEYAHMSFDESAGSIWIIPEEETNKIHLVDT